MTTSKSRKLSSLTLVVSFLGLGLTGFAAAQPVPSQYGPGPSDSNLAVDPPGRAGRLSDFEGTVWLYSPRTTAQSSEWFKAFRNRPLTTGDRVATEAGGRAEVQVGSSTLRLDSSTELEVVTLDDNRLALRLHSGNITLRVRDLEDAGQFEILTEEGRFDVPRAGYFRFDRADATSHATAYKGQLRYMGANNTSLPINAGQQAEFWIDQYGTAQYSLGTPLNDAFQRWNNDRDRRAAQAAVNTQRFVSPEMTGVAELDRYGRWENNSEYGSIWVPTTVAANWAPYRYGHWVWVNPWGWTWVDDAPWGFAPFHYGRWVYLRNNWCWTPGQRTVRPIYAPALVAWVGGPLGSVSVSIGGDRRHDRGHGNGDRDHRNRPTPNVGWFPLAPREVYVPSYRVSSQYAQNINVTHVSSTTQITAIINAPQLPRLYENQRYSHGVTVVPESVITQRRPVAQAALPVQQLPARPTPQAGEGSDNRNGFNRPAPGPSSLTAVAVSPVMAPAVSARPVVDRPASLPPMVRGGVEGVRTESRRGDGNRGAERPAPGRPTAQTLQQHPAPQQLAPAAAPVAASPTNSDHPVRRAVPVQAQPMPPVAPTMRAQPVRRIENQAAEPPSAQRPVEIRRPTAVPAQPEAGRSDGPQRRAEPARPEPNRVEQQR
jgi:hypothetical protein